MRGSPEPTRTTREVRSLWGPAPLYRIASRPCASNQPWMKSIAVRATPGVYDRKRTSLRVRENTSVLSFVTARSLRSLAAGQNSYYYIRRSLFRRRKRRFLGYQLLEQVRFVLVGRDRPRARRRDKGWGSKQPQPSAWEPVPGATRPKLPPLPRRTPRCRR